MINVHDILKIVTDVLRLQYGIEVEERYISQTVSIYESRDLVISKKNTLGLVDDNTGNVIRTVREIKHSRSEGAIVDCIEYKYDRNNNISEVTISNPPSNENESVVIHNNYDSDGRLISSKLDDIKFKLYKYSFDKLISIQYHNGSFAYTVDISYSNNGEYCKINIHDSINIESPNIRIFISFKKRRFSGDGWDMIIEAYAINPRSENVRLHVENDVYAYNTNYNHGKCYYRKPIKIKYNFSAGINTIYDGYINFMIPVNLLSKK